MSYYDISRKIAEGAVSDLPSWPWVKALEMPTGGQIVMLNHGTQSLPHWQPVYGGTSEECGGVKYAIELMLLAFSRRIADNAAPQAVGTLRDAAMQKTPGRVAAEKFWKRCGRVLDAEVWPHTIKLELVDDNIADADVDQVGDRYYAIACEMMGKVIDEAVAEERRACVNTIVDMTRLLPPGGETEENTLRNKVLAAAAAAILGRK